MHILLDLYSYYITNNPHLAIENATGYHLQEHTINIYARTSAQSD